MKPAAAWFTLFMVSAVVVACAPVTTTAVRSPVAPATSTAATAGIATPAATGTALQPGDLAPDFSLTDSEGALVELASIAADHASTVLVFYLSDT
jgi:hypothetical protein